MSEAVVDPVFQTLKDDFTFYAPRCLFIRTKEEGIQRFELNEAQVFIHDIAERQLRETGRVRIIVLKGRQQGMSTYIEGRFYWKVTHRHGARAYILTHHSDATTNLFAMASRYHEMCPPEVKPTTDRDSGRELSFDQLDSGYKVGTAGTKGVGRSDTIQYLHGSEVAFWPHAETHATGLMQAVPRLGSEVWLESTSDGMGNYFHQMWVQAVAGLNDYEAVFIPWYWQSEYEMAVEPGTTWDDEETELLERFEDDGMTEGNLRWRRWKIGELPHGIDQFKREYPNTPEEAFENAGYGQLIPGTHVERALKNALQQFPDGRMMIEARGPLVMGVDPARFGDDRLAICLRQGRVIFDVTSYAHAMDQMEITGFVKGILDALPIDRCFIDEGMGVGVIDRLHEMGYEVVHGVNFGAKAYNQVLYTNRRNEMWQEMALWFGDENVALLEPNCADRDAKARECQMDLCAVEYKFNSRNMKELEGKDQTKERLGLSPDCGDAIALTFAEPVAEYWHEDPGDPNQGRDSTTGY